MPTHAEQRILPYTPEQLFALVADIERYPEFLPWCVGARIRERKPDLIVADLIIGFRMFRERFTSRVALDPPGRIDVSYTEGPFRYLNNHWVFDPVAGGVPGIAAGLDQVFDGIDDAVGEEVSAQFVPQLLDRVEFGTVGRQKQQRDVGRHGEPRAGMPAGAVEDQHGMRSGADAAADLDEMLVHRDGIDHRHDDRGAGVARRAHRAEQVGVAEPQIARRGGALSLGPP